MIDTSKDDSGESKSMWTKGSSSLGFPMTYEESCEQLLVKEEGGLPQTWGAPSWIALCWKSYHLQENPRRWQSGHWFLQSIEIEVD